MWAVLFWSCSIPTAGHKPGQPSDTGAETAEPHETGLRLDDSGDSDDPETGAPGPLALDADTYVVGEHIDVTFSGAPGSGTDWVALSAAGADEESYTTWLYLDGTQTEATSGPTEGTLRFLPVNLPPGDWEARLYYNNGYERVASVPFTVVSDAAETAPAPMGDLTVLTFNIWYDGEGVSDGQAKVLKVIEDLQPDVALLQEAEVATWTALQPTLAALPGWEDADVDGAGDTVILSRYPIARSYRVADSDVYGDGYALMLPDGQLIRVFNTHLDYVKYGPYLARDGATVAEILAAESELRLANIEAILDGIVEPEDADLPTLLVGDHNTPSDLDWVDSNQDQNFGLSLPWPVSLRLAEAGFVDAWRAVYPDPVADRGYTWSPGAPKDTLDAEEVHDRIDFIYARDGADASWTALQAATWDADPWPSDHRAVIVSFALE